jgi:hypothetical protein
MFDREESQLLLFLLIMEIMSNWNNSDYMSTYEVYMFKAMLVWVNVFFFIDKFGQLGFFPKCLMCFLIF